MHFIVGWMKLYIYTDFACHLLVDAQGVFGLQWSSRSCCELGTSHYDYIYILQLWNLTCAQTRENILTLRIRS